MPRENCMVSLTVFSGQDRRGIPWQLADKQ
jgi:hypothetical protein